MIKKKQETSFLVLKEIIFHANDPEIIQNADLSVFVSFQSTLKTLESQCFFKETKRNLLIIKTPILFEFTKLEPVNSISFNIRTRNREQSSNINFSPSKFLSLNKNHHHELMIHKANNYFICFVLKILSRTSADISDYRTYSKSFSKSEPINFNKEFKEVSILLNFLFKSIWKKFTRIKTVKEMRNEKAKSIAKQKFFANENVKLKAVLNFKLEKNKILFEKTKNFCETLNPKLSFLKTKIHEMEVLLNHSSLEKDYFSYSLQNFKIYKYMLTKKILRVVVKKNELSALFDNVNKKIEKYLFELKHVNKHIYNNSLCFSLFSEYLAKIKFSIANILKVKESFNKFKTNFIKYNEAVENKKGLMQTKNLSYFIKELDNIYIFLIKNNTNASLTIINSLKQKEGLFLHKIAKNKEIMCTIFSLKLKLLFESI